METEQIVKELTETTARSKSNTKRLDAMEKRQNDLEDLTRAVAVVQTKQEQIETDVGEIKTDVKALMATPGKRWELHPLCRTVHLCVGSRQRDGNRDDYFHVRRLR